MLLLGAHLSISGGHHKALVLARKLKCNCVQVFVKNQRQWKAPDLTPEDLSAWNQTRAELEDEILHIVAHSAYLINLASDDAKVRSQSVIALADELHRCEQLGIDRLVLHPGSHRGQGTERGMELVTQALDTVLEDSRGVKILLETTAGAGNCLGGTIDEIARLTQMSRFPDRLGCCLDTCHLFAAGYKLWPERAFADLIGEIDSKLGLERVGCIHLNDSCGPLGSHLDRHTHIGKGCIGVEAFKAIVRSGSLSGIPKIIETPKGPKESLGFDRKNLRT